MGHVAGLEFKAKMDLGTTVPYISPPFDSCLITRKNQGIQKARLLTSLTPNLTVVETW